MGQHKRNPVAIAAKKGELPPKKPKMSKAKIEGLMYAKYQEALYDSLLPWSVVKEMLSNGKVY